MTRFENALALAKKNGAFEGSIGTLSEKTLHSVLKYYLEPCDDFHEVATDGFVADVMRDGCIIEVQTRGFDRLRKKLAAFLPQHPVTVVYPIAARKRIFLVDGESGELSKPRKSPRHGDVYDAFKELYRIKPLLKSENLYFHFILLDVAEYRHRVKKSHRNRKGVEVLERIPSEICSEVFIDGCEDFVKLLPPSLPSPFTSLDFARATKRTRGEASKALNVLSFVGTVVRCGKEKNSYLYEITDKDRYKNGKN